MADEIPISDVLCDAVEYLSKLGLNLRTRSESLKQKKINKSCLKNTHAVKKAANKVLLICELSKKSLENVENGVKQILSTVSSQLNDGAKLPPLLSQDDKKKKKFRVIEFDTFRLKVPINVPFEHFTSLKVSARNMSLKTQDKYPVFYDCKLFRLRRNREISKTKFKKVKGVSEEKSKVSDNETSLDTVQENYSNDIASVESMSNNSNKLNTESESSDIDAEKVTSDKTDSVNNIVEKVSDSNLETNENLENSKDKNLETKQKIREKRKKRRSNSSEDNEKHNTDAANSENAVGSPSKASTEDLHESKSKTSYNVKETSKVFNKSKRSRIIEIDDDSDSDEKRAKPNENLDRVEVNESVKDSPKKSECSNEDKPNTNEESTTNVDETKVKERCVSKPLIKCVSLSKLLKPDILKNDIELPTEKKVEYITYKRRHDRKLSNIKEKENKEKENEEKEESFWRQKRKEVTAFKAKKFNVHVTRLPQLTEKYLVDNNIKQVTKNGKVIVKVVDVQNQDITAIQSTDHEMLEEITTQSNVEIVSDESDLNKDKSDINQVKNALLNDSDSDDKSSQNQKEKESQDVCKIKNALLFESDSNAEEDKENPNSDSVIEVLDDSLIISKPNSVNENSTTETNNQQNLIENTKTSCDEQTAESKNPEPKTNSDQEIIKSSLLNDSSDENSLPIINRKKIHKKKSKSKRKNVSQSKFLSSSSDSDEDNIKRSVQKAATALLRRDSSSGDENSQQNQEKSHKETHSDSSSEKIQRQENTHKVTDSDSNSENIQSQKKSHKETHSDSSSDKIQSQEKSHKETNSDSSSEKMQSQEKSHNETHSDSSSEKMQSQEKSHKEIHSDSSSEKIQSQEKSHKETHSDSSSEEIQSQENSHKETHSDSSSEEIQSQENSHKETHSDSNSKKIQKYSEEEKDSSMSKEKISDDRAPIASSSGHSSDSRDASDKEINGLTNLDTLVKRRRRRRSSSSEKSKKPKRKKLKMPKVEPLGQQLLEAESNSDVASEAESDTVEDLPVVTMAPLNGGTDHLAKHDLLDDSDSSDETQDDKQADDKEDDSESDDNLKSKRRKANKISSDSEGGSSRKKDPDHEVKVSDFEDSGEESEPIKKSKRKKATDSDASGSSVEGKKKRRRIKQLNDSDASGSDSENEGKNKHGRKNIRRVMGKNQLEEATKKAAREEKERIARIAERQKTYNNLAFDESGKPDEVVLEKVVLDFDPETKEPIIEVDRGLVKKLKPHQANGIKFMWDACFESVKRIKKDRGSGCILAHCMGLGKTLQVVSLTHTLLTHEELTGVNRVLVVCPLSTVLNWVNEFHMWLKHAQKDYELDVYELSRYKQNSERAYQLQQWFRGGGVCVLGYEMFRNLSADNSKKFKKKMLKTFQESLVDPGPDLVVCDEGHLLKNEKTSLSQSMNRVKTLRRIVLTGTPLQNNLKEYYCMVQFVKPNLLGKYNEYLNRFVNPITNGQYTDSTEHDIRIMKRRSHVLHTMLDGAVQRRDYGVLAPFLPPKHEYVLFITLTDIQIKLYQHYLDNYSRRPLPGKSSGFLFPDFQSLQRIWTHPLVLKYNSERYEIMQQKKRDKEEEEDSEGSLADFIDDDDSTPDESSTEESQDDLSDGSDDSHKKNKQKKSKKSKGKEGRASARRGTRANPVEIGEEEEKVNSDVEEVKNENPTEWWIKLVEEDELEDLRNSHKLVLLFDILKQCEIIGDKLLVFSQSLYSLDLIEHFLEKVDEATQEGRIDEKLGGHIGTWSPGVDYFRLDGSTSCENRSIWCKNFNREDNPRARLFLISTRAGGLGINLVAANRVVIFDVSWNPSHDVQSIFRVYRFGQKKPCYIYRFLAMGTMEEKIYERQVTKQAISKRVIDEQQIDRHYKENDLAELYKFEPRPPEPRPLPALPKDRLFAEMLMEHEQQIYKFHEHDSLLENKEEETLTQEERKAAWEDFENEKNRPPPVPFTAATWGHNGLTPGMLAQQQQQIAYAALATMLRKDMPNINENQIRDMLPLIYNSNPGLMQKISEMYKYAQPGMMNPMMNPVMNLAGGVGGAGAMGGSSGLQYEPPWQRQQQMRLQQLMQHQNQMNAKMYAGGLGSRDPVAMALQQQRAREMMLGDRGRARGRPPLQPRGAPGQAMPPVSLLPPAAHAQPRATGDVVNLADSD